LTTAPPALLFVFRNGWAERARRVAAGTAPAESHGYFALADRGCDVAALDAADPVAARWRPVAEVVQRAYSIPRSGLGYRLHQARAVRARLHGDRGRIVVATTDSVGLPLLSLRERGRLTNPVLQISIGLADRIHTGRVAPRLARRYAALLEAARAVLVFAPREAELVRAAAPGARVHVIPFGVDAAWWAPPEAVAPRTATLLAPGRDPGRRFATLVRAVEGLPLTTTVVGSLAREQGVRPGQGLDVIDDVPLHELRAMLWDAELVALPTAAAAYGSGQSTALQAMAAGKPVVMADTGWAAHFGLRAGEHFVDVPPEDSDALRAALEELLARPDRGVAIGERARAAVAAGFSPQRQADTILAAAAAP
jgi:glycosyltransferase involved in cell wall biosynthesis